MKFFYKFGSFTSPGDIYYCSLDCNSNFEPKVTLCCYFAFVEILKLLILSYIVDQLLKV